jgi:protein TonB
MNIVEQESLRWGTSLAIVLATHAALIGGALWWANHSPVIANAAPMEAVMVELAPVPQAPPAPPTEVPPGPPQQQQVPQPKPAPRPTPKVPLPPEVKPEVEDPYQKPEEQQSEAPSDKEAVAVDQTLAPPDVKAQPADSYTARQTVSGTRGTAVVTWQGLLLGHLEKHRRYPRQAERTRQEGVVYVRFAVDRQGNVSNVRVGRASGHALLDEETLDTVRRGSPVPPPPAEIEGDPVEVMVPVEFFIKRR